MGRASVTRRVTPLRTGMKLRSRFLPLLVGAAALVAAAPAQTVDKSPTAKAEVVAKMNEIIARSAFVPNVDFAKWPKMLEAQNAKIEAAKTDEEFARAINGALREFGFSHIVLATPKAAKTRTSGKIVGIGITSQQTDDGIVVVRVVPKAPAAEAGLVSGDMIVEVDGKKPEGISGIAGEAGTKLVLKVKHTNGKTQDFRLTRREFSTVRPEELTWPTPDTAKLTVYTFDRSYSGDRVEELMKEAGRAKNLILDLRDNGGGAVLNLQHLGGLLMPTDKALGIVVDKGTIRRFTRETEQEPKDLVKVALKSGRKMMPFKNDIAPYMGNVSVLVNGGSGSASEILAAALQEQVGAKVIGAKSAGAVLVSVIVPVSNGFMLQYPLSDFVTPNGRRLEGAGVIPDFAVEEPRLRLPNAPDKAVEASLALFERERLRLARGIGDGVN